jgi:hypothetical protein
MGAVLKGAAKIIGAGGASFLGWKAGEKQLENKLKL